MVFGKKKPAKKTEPTAEAKALLAEAADAYRKHNYPDEFEAADRKTETVMGRLAAQRGAAIRWSEPPESRDGGE